MFYVVKVIFDSIGFALLAACVVLAYIYLRKLLRHGRIHKWRSVQILAMSSHIAYTTGLCFLLFSYLPDAAFTYKLISHTQSALLGTWLFAISYFSLLSHCYLQFVLASCRAFAVLEWMAYQIPSRRAALGVFISIVVAAVHVSLQTYEVHYSKSKWTKYLTIGFHTLPFVALVGVVICYKVIQTVVHRHFVGAEHYSFCHQAPESVVSALRSQFHISIFQFYFSISGQLILTFNAATRPAISEPYIAVAKCMYAWGGLVYLREQSVQVGKWNRWYPRC